MTQNSLNLKLEINEREINLKWSWVNISGSFRLKDKKTIKF
jgi:hypothetical protein